jgi:predicted ATPase
VIEKHRLYSSWRDGFAALELMRRGETSAGLEMLSNATRTMRDDAFGAYFGMFLAGRVEGLMGDGMLDDALSAADAALAHCRAANEYWYVPELIRLRGEILLRKGHPASLAEAERDFRVGLDLARSQTALAWELRIAISLARLRREQGQIGAARETLLPVYARFAEGFETRDLLAAKQFLGELT